ncbi:MAG: biotin--[acetyl-CoA-carboxylase] ligase [Defluviitaleaceae bacterium]|nr:biotin--[acetyl-CoA-carboxylase] ligase [Defluviitaleaceae bacterium]
MSTKERTLALLEAKRGQTVSGEAIAAQLDISRSAVWKAVNGLKKDGYQIESSTNRGYCLRDDNNILSVAGMLPFLKQGGANIQVHQKVESTNIIARELAVKGAAHGTVIMADEQTAGRGRYGRQFFSPPGHGLYMSFVLDPSQLGVTTPGLITTYTAVVVCEAIEAICGISPKVKWVNDLFLRGRKICGISAEAVMDLESGIMQWIVVGIGINFTLPELPEALQAIVGAVYEGALPPVDITRNRLAAEVINRLLAPPYSQKDIIERYRQRLFILGMQVRVEGAVEPYEATVLDVDEMGQLLVRNGAGDVVTLSAGEISIRF